MNKETTVPTTLIIECAFCGLLMGEKDGLGSTGTTSTICPDCIREHYPSYADKLLAV